MSARKLIQDLTRQARAYDADPSPARANVLFRTLLWIEEEAMTQLARAGGAPGADLKNLADTAGAVREAGERSTRHPQKDFGRYVETQLRDFRIAAGLNPDTGR